MYRILSISENVRLLITRNDALAIAGFSVVSPKTPEEAPLIAGEREPDAAIIGHSVEPEKRKTIIPEIRRHCPDCLIVFVYVAPETAMEPLADVSLDVTDSAEPLIKALQEKLELPPS
jgi:hypothetical protein